MSKHVCFSHSELDEAVANELRQGLEALVDELDNKKYNVTLAPLDLAAAEAAQLAEKAGSFMVLFSSGSLRSDRIAADISKAIEFQQQRRGYMIVPVLLPDVEASSIEEFFKAAQGSVQNPVVVEYGEQGMQKTIASLDEILSGPKTGRGLA